MTDDVGASTRLGERFGVRPGWQVARLLATRPESVTARTLELAVPRWPGHLAGQHVDLRLTASDGYTAERSYSLAAPPEPFDDDGVPSSRLELAVQRVPGGEVSTYLADDFAAGQLIEVRGPIGGWFVWSPGDDGGAPVLLVAGGSGIVPLMAMVRERRRAGDRTPFRLVYSVRRPEDRLYVGELTRPPRGDDGVDVTVLFTRSAPLDAPRPPGRLTPSDLAAAGWPADFAPRCFVCGPTGFVEAATRQLLALGHDPARIRTERFGPSGD